MPPTGSVTITWHPDTETITLDPEVGQLDRNIQIMQWSLVVPSGSPALFANPGIIFEPAPPAPSAWPGFPPVRENSWQYRANVNHKVAHGQQPQTYAYFIDIDTGGGKIIRFLSSRHEGQPVSAEEKRVPKVLKFDPDIENQPQP